MFLDPQNEVGPSISSLVVQCSFVLLVYIAVLAQQTGEGVGESPAP